MMLRYSFGMTEEADAIENAASIRAEVERNAASIATAFENQLDALYAAESMEIGRAHV